MVIDLFGRGPYDYSIRKLIMDMKEQYLADGGDPVHFSKYLESAGVRADGQFIVVSDSFEMIAKLKYVR